MDEQTALSRLNTIIRQDTWRMSILQTVASLDIPQCYVAAGFLRNMAWDANHGFDDMSPLEDVDVIYFDSSQIDRSEDRRWEIALSQKMPTVNWQVKNQARMHLRNGHQAYTDIVSAMRYWPEKETAVAVRLTGEQLEWCSGFGFMCLFNNTISYNELRPYALFEQRIAKKQWQRHWPMLRVLGSKQDDIHDTER